MPVGNFYENAPEFCASPVRTLQFFPVRFLIPTLATFNLTIVRARPRAMAVRFDEVLGETKDTCSYHFATLFRVDPPEGRLEDLLFPAWQQLQRVYPAVLAWRKTI